MFGLGRIFSTLLDLPFPNKICWLRYLTLHEHQGAVLPRKFSMFYPRFRNANRAPVYVCMYSFKSLPSHKREANGTS